MPLLFLFSMGISKIRILTGCCDNTIHLWNINGTHRLKVPGHCGPIKGVKWIEIKELCATFASVSDDETVMLWKLDIGTETVECIQIGRVHERIINFVSVNKNASLLVTGGWDNMLKIWGASNNLLFCTGNHYFLILTLLSYRWNPNRWRLWKWAQQWQRWQKNSGKSEFNLQSKPCNLS